MIKFCAVIPVYNHCKKLAFITKTVTSHGIPCIIVDDGSDRKTRLEIKTITASNAEVESLALEKNSGKGIAVIKGFRHAYSRGFTHAIQIDGDNQHDTGDIPHICRLAKENPNSMIIGYPVFGSDAPVSRKIGRKVSRFWVKLETLSLNIKDPLCGFRCYPLKQTVTVTDKYRIGSRMDFDPHILLRLYWEGIEVVNFDTRIQYDSGEDSKFRMLRDNARISFMFFRMFWVWLFKTPCLIRRNFDRYHGGKNWAQMQERGSGAGIRLSFFIYRILGKELTLIILKPVIYYFLFTGKSSRKASRKYLTHVSKFCKDQKKIPQNPGFSHVSRHYHQFSGDLIDRIGIRSGLIKDIKLNWHGKEKILDYSRQGRGGIIMSAHLGSIDSLRVILSKTEEIRVRPLMYRTHSKKINSVFKSINKKAESEIIPLESITVSSALKFQKIIDNGEFLGILADRVSAGSKEKNIFTDFLGEKAAFPQGPWILAGILKCPVLLLFAVNSGKNRYDIFCENFFEKIILSRKDREKKMKKIVSSFSTRLEHHCCRFPYQWSNFYDFWQ